MNREDIHIISRHSNWSAEGIEKVLKDKIYSDVKSWKKFLQLLFISLGVGFTVSGVIFFFAYNWTDLHKFVKLGLIEGLIVAASCIVLFSKLNLKTKNILLTGISILVGVLIAVFGQIYQTGANAYDFFVGWTLFISLWVFISNFPPLWLVYLVLVNTSFVLYSQQVASHWSIVFVFTVLFLLNVAVLLTSHFLPKLNKGANVPVWFTTIAGIASVTFSTIGITIGIFDKQQISFIVLLLITTFLYIMGIAYGLKEKKGFYISLIPASIIFIVSALLIKISDGASMFFVICLFIIGSVSLLIKALLDLQKKWNHGK